MGTESVFQPLDSVASFLALAPRQRDVGVILARFRRKAAGRGRGEDLLLERGEFGSEPHAGEKHPGTVKKSKRFKLNGDGR